MLSPGSTPLKLHVSNRYLVRRRLGKGSLGTVYLAWDQHAGRPVALKLLDPERLDPEGLFELQREFQAFASLRHPQIAVAFDFGYTEEGRLPFYTREFVEGAPLAAGPPGVPGIPPREFLQPIFHLLEALEYLHAHELLHLDIHPGNLIVAADPGRGAVLIDFGIVPPLRRSASAGVFLLGSALAPEVLAGERIGPQADIYSAGRLLLHRMGGRRDEEPRLPREAPGWDPRWLLGLERIAAKALHRDPAKRFQSVREFLEALGGTFRPAKPRPRGGEPGEVTMGRGKDLEAIEEALDRAAQGKVAVLWIEGKQGMGKTRLLTEARLRAQLRALRVIDARFHEGPMEESTLHRALRLSPGKRRGRPSWLRALLPERGGTPEERARRAVASCFLEGGEPLVLLLDDFERADPESRVLATAFLEGCALRMSERSPGRGLALIATSTVVSPPPASRFPRAWKRKLAPLAAKDSTALLDRLLRPLRVPRPFVARLSRLGRGVPARLRRLAGAVGDRFAGVGRIHSGSELPEEILRAAKSDAIPLLPPGPDGVRILRALLALGRPARIEEIAAAVDLPLDAARSVVRRLERDEALEASMQGGARHFYPANPGAAAARLEAMSAEESVLVHERMVNLLLGKGARSGESLARHLLASGRVEEGRKTALEAALRLRKRGRHQAAVRLLEEAAAREVETVWKIRFAEELSAIHQDTGSHRDGIRILEPIHRALLGDASRPEAIRLRRRLGVHYHRAGLAENAARLFSEIRSRADPIRDIEELVFVESELAEMHTLRGEYPEAELACRRGLLCLEQVPGDRTAFRAGVEVVLRASLGHLELRRLDLGRSRTELEAALRLARSRKRTDLRALILQNLGIVHNQLNDLPRARSFYRRAEALLARLGDHGAMLHAACNLATIAAKQGDAAAARDHIERASSLLAHSPGKRFEFVVELCSGMAAHFLGDARVAIEALERAVGLGRALGDEQHAAFADVYLAESQIACGRYAEALRCLRALASRLEDGSPPVLARMVRSRLVLLEALLGRPRASRRAERALDRIPRSTLTLLEAWNDLFLAAGRLLAGGSGARMLSGQALRVFRKVGVPAGERLARALCSLEDAIEGQGSRERKRGSPRGTRRGESTHKLLGVIEPLLEAAARLRRGEIENAEDSLNTAAGGIVGLPFLELDGWIELLRARSAEVRGDLVNARRFVHRSLQVRDLLARSLPPRLRAPFLSQSRFGALDTIADRLRRPGPAPVGVGRAAPAGTEVHGMIGRSRVMLRVFEAIERSGDHALPVLVLGETGTGKDRVARAIHAAGPRRSGPFFSLHCGSLPAELFESELFGHEAGAFTGAEESRPGLLTGLAGGTLLLDEVSHLAPGLQAKILRVLDARRVRPLGGLEEKPVDVRFIASSSADLRALMASGSFREDLYYRLSSFVIDIPPLRRRKEDIGLLARHLLDEDARRLERPRPHVESEVLRVLLDFDWPGNVRQLQNVLLRALLASSPGEPLSARDLRRLLAEPRGEDPFPERIIAGRDLRQLRSELEKSYLAWLFREKRGNLEAMAGVLGVKVSNLYHWFRRVGLSIRDLRREVED